MHLHPLYPSSYEFLVLMKLTSSQAAQSIYKITKNNITIYSLEYTTHLTFQTSTLA